MDFQIIQDSEKAGYAKFQVRSKLVYTSEFIRLGLLHNSFKINMFAAGVKEVTRDLSLLKKHLPGCVDLESIAFAYSDKDSFVEFSFSNTFFLQYRDSELVVIKGTPLESVDLTVLFGSSETPEPFNLPDLKKLEEVKAQKTVASYCGVVLDCCGSYLKPTSKDYLATFKVTDPSLFPDFASVNVFHKTVDALPKVKNLGDVIYFHHLAFNEYQGRVQGTLSASSKQAAFYVFDYEEKTCKPYAWYRNPYFKESEVEDRVYSLKSWVRNVFEDKVQEYLNNNTQMLKEVKPGSEDFDLIGKVLAIGRLGVSLSDPLYLHLQVQNDGRVYHVTIPKEKKKLITYVKVADTVRIRSLFKAFGVFLVSDFTEILRIRFETMKIQENPAVYQSLERFQMAIGTKVKKEKLSVIPEKAFKYPKISLNLLEGHPDGSIFRVRGFLLRIFSDSRFRVAIWDPKDQENYLTAYVQNEDVPEFMNGFQVDQVNNSEKRVFNPFRCLVKISFEEYQIISTKLVDIKET